MGGKGCWGAGTRACAWLSFLLIHFLIHLKTMKTTIAQITYMTMSVASRPSPEFLDIFMSPTFTVSLLCSSPLVALGCLGLHIMIFYDSLVTVFDEKI